MLQLLQPEPPFGMILWSLSFVPLGCLPLYTLRRQGALDKSVHLLLTGLAMGIAPINFASNGTLPVITITIATLPMIAILGAGLRVGAVWTFITYLLLLGPLLLGHYEVPPLLPRLGHGELPQVVLGLATAVSALSGLALVYEAMKNQALEELNVANEHAEAANREKDRYLAILREERETLKAEIRDRKSAEARARRLQDQMVESSRMAGRTEIVTSVLHEVGNALNSVRTSSTLLRERISRIRFDRLERGLARVPSEKEDLIQFLAEDAKGRKLFDYLRAVTSSLRDDQDQMLASIATLGDQVDHIDKILNVQTRLATGSGFSVAVDLEPFTEDVLLSFRDTFSSHDVELRSMVDGSVTLMLDRQKLFQLLGYLLINALEAVVEAAPDAGFVELAIRRDGADHVSISVRDNGGGIALDQQSRIFAHGFTTKANGNGFGLHTAALTAGELGGTLAIAETRVGGGTTFTLELPIAAPPREPSKNLEGAES